MKRIKRITGLLTAVLAACVGVQPVCADDFLTEGSDGTYECHYLTMNKAMKVVTIDHGNTFFPYNKSGNTLSFNWGDKSVSVQKGAYPNILTGTVTDNTDGSVKKCEILGSRDRIERNDSVWNYLSSNNHLSAFIKIKSKEQKKTIAIPANVKFIPEPWVDSQLIQCGLLSVTSDNPMAASLGNLNCVYYLNRNQFKNLEPFSLNIVLCDGVDKQIRFPGYDDTDWTNSSRLGYGIFELNYGKRELSGLGEVDIELTVYF